MYRVRKGVRPYIAGLLTAFLICGLIGTASAFTGKVTQELEYRDIRVSLDGEVLDLRNAIGEKVEPFMFGGTNYLPVRALAEALGLNVEWDGANVMVVLTTPEPEPAAPVIEGPSAGDLGQYHVEIKGARLAQDYNGKNAIVITYAWTNNSEKTANAMVSMMESAFQNGVQLDGAIVLDALDNTLREVRPGVTIDIEKAYLLTSDTAPVEFEVTEFLGKTGGAVAKTFNPANLTGASGTSATTTSTVSTVTSETASTSVDRTVYVTPTGKHYHYSSSCNGGKYTPSTLSAAVARGLTPCDKCVLTGN